MGAAGIVFVSWSVFQRERQTLSAKRYVGNFFFCSNAYAALEEVGSHLIAFVGKHVS